MTDGSANKQIVLSEWDFHADKVKNAKTVEQLAPSLGFYFMATRPFIERETVLEKECAERVENCPARALASGDLSRGKRALQQILTVHFPWLLLVGLLSWLLIRSYFKAGG